TTEFNNAMKRLKALGYQIIYISKEKVEEYTLRGGAKRTTFKPNINDKVANFLSGTVDLTLRAYVDADDKRFLQLAKKQNVFGGGRYDFQVDTIPLDMEAFIEELTAAQGDTASKTEKPKRERKKKEKPQDEENVAKKTMYFQHEGSEDFVVVKKGESLDFLEDDIFDERTKKDYEKWLAENEEESADDEPEEKPKRERRSRK
ncbi:AAA family ATPase, partial [Bacillus cereus]|nr:AAA family ATPase [Bacillus cereus]